MESTTGRVLVVIFVLCLEFDSVDSVAAISSSSSSSTLSLSSSSLSSSLSKFSKIPSGLSSETGNRITENIFEILKSLEQSSSVRFRILYDSKFQEISNNIVTNYKTEEGMMSSQYEVTVSLKELLKPSPRPVFLILLCSAQNTIGLFSKVRKQRLESHHILWLIVVEDDEDLPIEDLNLSLKLVEGNRVHVVSKVTLAPSSFRLHSLLPDVKGDMSFVDQGTWNTQNPRSKELIGDLLLSDHLDLYENLNGRELRVAANNKLPYTQREQVLEDGTVIPPYGLDLTIGENIGEFMNFTQRVVHTPDGKWGGPLPNGSATGLIGMVARREAEFAVSGITILAIRETVVDFTFTYTMDSLNLLSKAPQRKNSAFAAFSPYNLQVWLCLIAFTVIIGPLITIQSKIIQLFPIDSLQEEYSTWDSLQLYSFNMFRSLVLQGNMIEPHVWSQRIVFFFWYIFVVLNYALYSGTLTAVFAIPSFEKPFDSLLDLPRAIQSGFVVGTLQDSMIEFLLKGAKEGLYRETWLIINAAEQPENLVPFPGLAYEKVENENYIFIGTVGASSYEAAFRGRSKFHLGRQSFYPMNYGFAFYPGSPLEKRFSFLMSRMSEAGLIRKWELDEYLKMKDTSGGGDSSAPTPINLNNIQAAFIVLILGMFVAAVSLILEMIYFRLNYEEEKNIKN